MESLILEKQPSALGAYSTRILRRDYQRALMRVRRSVDNVQADVRADSNGIISLDSRISVASGTSAATTLGEFVANPSYTDVDSLGSTSAASVSIWYDQSGSNSHMTQVVDNYQPLIVASNGLLTQGANGPQVAFFPSFCFMDLRELVGDFTVYFSFKVPPTTSIKLYDGTNDLINVSRSSNDITLSQITNSDLHLDGYNKGDSTSVDFDSGSDTTLTVSGTFASTGSAKIGTGNGTLSDFYIYPKLKKAKKRRDIEVVTTREKESRLSYSNRGDIDTTAFLNKFEGFANAFSLRSLNKEDSNPLIAVRREIDHKEVFVFPDASGFVSLSSLVSESFKRTTGIAPGPHLSVPPTKATTLGQFMGDASSSDPDSLGSPTTGRVVTMFDQVSANETLRRRLLDYHTGAEAAYSTKRLSTSYTGPCLEISIFSSVSPYNLISSSDINFDSSGSISKTFSAFRSQSLQTHGASTIIKVSKIYDQSGNGRHLTQSSRDEMPGILLNSINGEVGLAFGASSGSYRQSMSVPSLSIPTPFSYSTSFFRGLGTIDGYKYIDFGGGVSIQSGATAELSVSDGSNSIEPSGFMPQYVVNHVYGVHDDSSSEFGYNGSVTSGSGLTTSITSIQINESGQSTDIDQMYFHELIVWGENKSTDQGQKEDIDLYSQELYRNEDANAKAIASTAQPKIYDATNGLVEDAGSVSLEVAQNNYFLFNKSKISGKSNVSSFVSFSTDDIRGYLYALDASYHGPRMHITTSAPYVSNLGTPSSFIDGEEAAISNSVESYNLLSDSTKKILSTVGADTSSWGSYNAVNEVTLFNYYQDVGTNDTFSGKFQELIFFNSDVSNDRDAIENDMNNAFNSYSSSKSLGRQKLLNEYPGAAAAYSVRQVNANYSGPIMRVDNGYSEVDIYPLINGDLDTDAIIEHAKGNPVSPIAKISVWYDQSGNGNDAVQPSNSSQPTICRNLSIVYENGKPAVQFDGANNYLNSNTIPVSSYPFTIIDVSNPEGTNPKFVVSLADSTVGNKVFAHLYNSQDGKNQVMARNTSVYRDGASYVNGNQYLSFLDFGSSTSQSIFQDGNLGANLTTTTPYFTANRFTIGYSLDSTPSDPMQGTIQEVILYDASKTSVRTDIEFNINKYFDISPQGPTKLLLDKYPGSAAAYSLRKLSAKYSGPAIKIRRASDSLEADVYFDKSGNISLESIVTNVSETTTGKPQGNATFNLGVATLGEFVGNIKYSSAGVTDAFVVVWYDQSSNGNDAQQLNAASQPKVVNAGFVVAEGKKPAVQFDGSDDVLSGSSINPTNDLTMITVYNCASGTRFQNLFGQGVGFMGPTQTNTDFSYGLNNNLIEPDIQNTNLQAVYLLSASTTRNKQELGELYYSRNANAYVYVDGSLGHSVTTPDYPIRNAHVLSIGGTLFPPNAKIQEAIVYNSDESANRTNIESDINNHYSIYTPELKLGLINEFDGAAAAYSLRLLNYFYQGPLVRVRRDSDHVEVDVYPDENGVFSERSLVRNTVESSTGVTVGSPNDTTAFRFGEFAYNTNCFVVEWKDQSTNNNHATQNAAANQPKIYDSSTGIIQRSQKNAIDFTGSYSLRCTTGQMNQPNTTFFVADLISGKPIDAGNRTTRRNYELTGGGNFALWADDYPFTSTTGGGFTGTSNLQIISTVLNGSSTEHKLNNNTEQTCAAYTDSSVGFYFGGQNNGSSDNFNGSLYISEFIAYPSDESAYRTDIHDNMNTLYNIY